MVSTTGCPVSFNWRRNSDVFRLKFESELMSLLIFSMAVCSVHSICIRFDAITERQGWQSGYGKDAEERPPRDLEGTGNAGAVSPEIHIQNDRASTSLFTVPNACVRP